MQDIARGDPYKVLLYKGRNWHCCNTWQWMTFSINLLLYVCVMPQNNYSHSSTEMQVCILRKSCVTEILFGFHNNKKLLVGCKHIGCPATFSISIFAYSFIYWFLIALRFYPLTLRVVIFLWWGTLCKLLRIQSAVYP